MRKKCLLVLALLPILPRNNSDFLPLNTAIVTYITPDGRKLFVDFMGNLIELRNEEIRKTAVELDHSEYGLICVLHPTLVLKSRIVNLHRLAQKRHTNGGEQARLAVPVVKAFLEYYVGNGLAGAKPDKYLIDRIMWLHDQRREVCLCRVGHRCHAGRTDG